MVINVVLVCWDDLVVIGLFEVWSWFYILLNGCGFDIDGSYVEFRMGRVFVLFFILVVLE